MIKEMGESGREHVAQNFSLDKFAINFEQCLLD